MNEGASEAASKLVAKTYVNQAKDAKRTHEKAIQHLIQQVGKGSIPIWGNEIFFHKGKVPEYGWSDLRIELLLQELALMDSNNFPGKCQLNSQCYRVHVCVCVCVVW